MSEQTELLLTAINDIQKYLMQQSKITKDLSLFSGQAGELLFLAELSQSGLFQHDCTLEWQPRLEQLLANAESVFPDLSIGGGLSGIAWLTDFIVERAGGDLADGFHTNFEAMLTHSLLNTKSIGVADLDFVTAITGFAPFILLRKSSGNCSLQAKLLKEFYLRHPLFDEMNGINQTTFVNFDTGIAHGVTGPLLALCHFADEVQVQNLLRQQSGWLIASLDAEENTTADLGIQHRQLGWCYGELAHTFVLLKIGLALESPQIIEQARHHAIRLSLVRQHLNDTSLCHGSAGVMLIFQLFTSFLPDPELSIAADYWLTEVLNTYNQSGLTAFNFFNGVSFEVCEGLLEGYAGVGLCLLSKITKDTEWCQCLLLTEQ